jgi:hypothetical protein
MAKPKLSDSQIWRASTLGDHIPSRSYRKLLGVSPLWWRMISASLSVGSR